MSGTKSQRRRNLLLKEHWLGFQGNRKNPGFDARKARKALKIR